MKRLQKQRPQPQKNLSWIQVPMSMVSAAVSTVRLMFLGLGTIFLLWYSMIAYDKLCDEIDKKTLKFTTLRCSNTVGTKLVPE
jgi:hypothetical protein